MALQAMLSCLCPGFSKHVIGFCAGFPDGAGGKDQPQGLFVTLEERIDRLSVLKKAVHVQGPAQCTLARANALSWLASIDFCVEARIGSVERVGLVEMRSTAEAGALFLHAVLLVVSRHLLPGEALAFSANPERREIVIAVTGK